MSWHNPSFDIQVQLLQSLAAVGAVFIGSQRWKTSKLLVCALCNFPCHLCDRRCCVAAALLLTLVQLDPGRTMHSVSSSSCPRRRRYMTVEETLNDVNNVPLKSSTEEETGGLHDVSSCHCATMLR